MRKGWELKKLGEVCEFQGGSQPPKSKFIYEPKKGYVRFLQIRDFASNKNETYIPESNKNRYCNESDILLGRYGASVGKVLINKAGAYNVAVMKTIPIESLLIKSYFYYYLISSDFQQQLLNVASRSAQDGFSKDDIYDFPIVIPPIPEQKRIVTILDKIFAAIDQAKANTQKTLQNAKEIFESYLQRGFESKEEDWDVKTIGEIADIEYGFTANSSDVGDFRYIRITDINKNGLLINDDKKYLKRSKEAEYYILKDKDLLMARTGATFAKVLLYEDYQPSVFASYLIKINFTEKIDNELYWFFTKTKCYWDQANGLAAGAAQPQFNGAALKQVKFSYPKSLKTQKDLVKTFKLLEFQTKKLEEACFKKLDDLDELKKSILQKAFTGELTQSFESKMSSR